MCDGHCAVIDPLYSHVVRQVHCSDVMQCLYEYTSSSTPKCIDTIIKRLISVVICICV